MNYPGLQTSKQATNPKSRSSGTPSPAAAEIAREDNSRGEGASFWLSLLFHLLVFLGFYFFGPESAPAPEVTRSVRISLLEPEKAEERPMDKEKKQIVETEVAIDAVPEDSRFLAEKDSVTEKEQLKRGNGETSPVSKPEKESESAKKVEVETPEASKKPAEEKQLKLQDAEDKSTSSPKPSRKPEPKPERAEPEPRLPVTPEGSELQFSLSGKALASLSDTQETAEDTSKASEAASNPARRTTDRELSMAAGQADFLPDIPDGDITFLNAKASRYAIFVRRVALQVFSELRKQSWSQLSHRQVLAAKSDSVFRATLSASGNLQKTEALSGSGSDDFDKALRVAVREGAWDENPPAGARAEDGKIHFIFKARSYARVVAGRQQRWILLSTGLL